ncbi:hypothetical protein J3F84DRAFT_374474 [Trichoderma pleuroticola]
MPAPPCAFLLIPFGRATNLSSVFLICLVLCCILMPLPCHLHSMTLLMMEPDITTSCKSPTTANLASKLRNK